MEKTRDLTIHPSNELTKKLQEETSRRKLNNTHETVSIIPKEYFKRPPITRETEAHPNKGRVQWLRNLRRNKYVHSFLFTVYGLILLIFAINLVNVQLPILSYLNLTYAEIHTQTDYFFAQFYPPSINAWYIGNHNQTIYLQVHLHADTKITENTPVTIEAQASEGSQYADNVSEMYVGFFGADYTPDNAVVFQIGNTTSKYELWTGFAGATLVPNAPQQVFAMLDLGTDLGGNSRRIYWSTSGEKPLSLVLVWSNVLDDIYYTYTYNYSIVRVYSMGEIRANQIVDAEVIGVFGGLLFGALEVYPNIRGKEKQEDS
jgi:hypothetical protein